MVKCKECRFRVRGRSHEEGDHHLRRVPISSKNMTAWNRLRTETRATAEKR